MWTSTIAGIKHRPLTATAIAFAAVGGVWAGASYLFARSPKQHATDMALGPLDLTKIRDYSFNRQRREPYASPFLAHFYKGNKHLYYVAAHHDVGPENETFATVREAMQRAKPQLVIIEGLETSKGINAPFFQKVIERDRTKHFEGVMEGPYAASLAMAHNIPFVGGEPSESEVFRHMRAMGYSNRDVMGFYVLKRLPQWKEQNGANAQTLPAMIQKFLAGPNRLDGVILPEQRIAYEDFMAWYNEHNDTQGRGIAQLETNDLAPLNGPNATYFQTLSAANNSIREQHLDQLIADAMKEHDRVVVVYGSGHLTQSRPVYEQMFGNVEHYKIGQQTGFAQKVNSERTPAQMPVAPSIA